MLAVFFTIVSAVLFNVGLVLQSIDPGTLPDSISRRPLQFFTLIRRPLWVFGILATLVAVGTEILALRTLPLVFVQPCIAAGICIVPILSHVLLRERINSSHARAVACTVIGVAALGIVAAKPQSVSPSIGVYSMIIVVSAAVIVGFIVATRISGAVAYGLLAGVGYAATGLLFKLAAVSGSLLTVSAVGGAIAIAGAFAFLGETTALQSASATIVGPVVLAAATALPVLVEPILFHSPWHNVQVTAVALALTLFGVLWLARIPHQAVAFVAKNPANCVREF